MAPTAAPAVPHRMTILELCVRQAGGTPAVVPKAARVCELIVAWAIATRAEGRPLGIEAFQEHWGAGYPRRSAYRHLAEFRELFPEHETPQRLADALLAAAAGRGEPGVLTRIAAA